ncbi:NAD-dependent epimerase/dehydratase family protein [Roseomonas xinghualingensis]|uniref:NAD-dependent epimerase/dehydratase family protein n=1 Tax=Roseomonas xinghualingensis TaxID=2986475 RepID=UPI0036734090
MFGAAGLVGQNLVLLLQEQGFRDLVAVDKHPANVATLRRLHPKVKVIEADMADSGAWEEACVGAAACAMLQAQIGGEMEEAFRRNNIVATERALAAMKRHGVPYLVHVSSSVVNSMARDWYTETKKAQEALVAQSGIPHVVLRPTLMFGLFDRKHLGWLSRFMRRLPVFPIPGSGRYMRQPLYARDFCRIIASCLASRTTGAYNITGREKVDYVDIIRGIKHVTGARAAILHIPYTAFWIMLKVYGLAIPNAPFTTKQLKALVTPDEFELIPWWDIFDIRPTPFGTALTETFGPGPYSDVTLEF